MAHTPNHTPSKAAAANSTVTPPTPPRPEAGRDLVILLSGQPRRYRRLLGGIVAGLKDFQEPHDVVLVEYRPHLASASAPAAATMRLGGVDVPHLIFTEKDATALPYDFIQARQQFSLKPGNVDIAFLLAAKARPGYARYWFIEDDVAASGSMGVVLTRLAAFDEDFLCTHLHQGDPGWDYVPLFNFAAQGAPLIANYKLAFIPFFRLSAAGVAALDAAYRANWCGHAEMVLPAVMAHAGLRTRDIGGSGSDAGHAHADQVYSEQGYSGQGYSGQIYTGPFYTGGPVLTPMGTIKTGGFVPTPARLRPGSPAGLLWHPVKPFGDWLTSWRKRLLSLTRYYMRRILGKL